MIQRMRQKYFICPVYKNMRKNIVSFHPSFETPTFDHFYSDLEPELF